MMKNIKYLLGFVLALWASALSAQSHWSVNPSDFENQMTVWFVLQNDKVTLPVADFNNYEVAAFVGDECRGVSTVVTSGDNTVCQIIVRSNAISGEKITFRCYDKTAMEEKELFGSAIVFENLGQVGMPSNPYVLDLVMQYIPGDVDGDGEFTINDVIMTINAALGNPSPSFIAEAADMDGDGEITINDVIKIINLVL
jgi:hypothetical protein